VTLPMRQRGEVASRNVQQHASLPRMS
jgi:hypothetical protein